MGDTVIFAFGSFLLLLTAAAWILMFLPLIKEGRRHEKGPTPSDPRTGEQAE
jgi:hypothetical protein